MLKPDANVDKVTDITIDFLKENNIRGIILDVDNTLIGLNKKKIDNIENWVKEVKKSGIKLCIASNSHNRDRVQKIAETLDIPYVFLSMKPSKIGLNKAVKLLEIDKMENIAEIGDQLFTDVLGARRMGMFSILTTPIEKEKDIISKGKRKLEYIVINNNQQDNKTMNNHKAPIKHKEYKEREER